MKNAIEMAWCVAGFGLMCAAVLVPMTIMFLHLLAPKRGVRYRQDDVYIQIDDQRLL